MGETNWEQGQIEMATDVMGDIFAAFASWFREKDETLKVFPNSHFTNTPSTSIVHIHN